ncbi:hypothetical protein, partial [Micromonospora foliorum]|uniref:hypothetical protein n=1 Tax=Micromonospora foliorum TaxID=2911210 RepID=UPI001EE90C40
MGERLGCGAALGGDGWGWGQRGGEAGDGGFAGAVDRDVHRTVGHAEAVDPYGTQLCSRQGRQSDRAARYVRVEPRGGLEQQHRARRGPRRRPARGSTRSGRHSK